MLAYFKQDQETRNQIILLLIEAIFIVLIWLPNFFCFYKFVPYLVNEKTLQSNLLIKTTAFIDTAKYYACAQIAKNTPQAIWDPSALQKWFANYLKISQPLDTSDTNKLSYSPYTPQAIVMFMPLTALPLHIVIIIIEFATLLSMLVPITLLIKKYFNVATLDILRWWLIALASVPITINFYFGQLDGLLAGLAAIFILQWQNKNCIAAALSLAITLAIKPQRALLMLVMALADKRFKLLFWTSLMSIIFLTITIYVLGWNTVIMYPTKLMSIHQAIDAYKLPDAAATTVSILGLVSLVCGQQAGHIISFGSTISFLILTYLIWRRALRAGQHSYPYAYAATVLLSFICTPYQHIYSLILLCVVWAGTIPATSISKILKVQKSALRYWCLLFFFFPAPHVDTLLFWFTFYFHRC